MIDELHLKGLLRALSHDLRGSIGATSTLTNMLLETYCSQLDERGNKWLAMLATENNSVSTKLIGLSSYAKLFDYQPLVTNCSLDEIAQLCLRDADLKANGVKIALETDGLLIISTDHALMQKYLKELLINSFQHAKPANINNGDILVKCHLSYKPIESGYSLVYQDNGQALSINELDYIKQAFNTLKSSRGKGQSAGLGLSKLQRIAELLNAKLDFEIGEAPYTGLKITFSYTEHNNK